VSDNLVLARLREELDTTANKAREDRIIINGLVCKLPLPVEIRAKTEMLREVVTGVFNFLIPDFQGKITFVSQGKSVASPLPMVEVRLDSVENAAAVRKAFAEKSRSRLLTGDFEKLFITNSVNLATRVRIDVMKAIAKNVSSTNVKAYVVGFISRPILHVKKVLTGSHLSYTFVDSIMKYSNLIRPADLAAAYRRAGSSFDGQLQQNFVLVLANNSSKRKSFNGTLALYFCRLDILNNFLRFEKNQKLMKMIRLKNRNLLSSFLL
jgi:hypothetical protein